MIRDRPATWVRGPALHGHQQPPPPEPSGSIATRGMRSRRRMSSRCQAAAWLSSQWLHRTVMAGCRCVKPGMRTSTSCSARAADARMRSARLLRMSRSWATSHRRVSVATCKTQPCCQRHKHSATVGRGKHSTALHAFSCWHCCIRERNTSAVCCTAPCSCASSCCSEGVGQG